MEIRDILTGPMASDTNHFLMTPDADAVRLIGTTAESFFL
jgi:hypothetical protein